MPRFAVCPRCGGTGFVSNPAFDGMSTSELREELGDEETREFLDEYTTRGGMFDLLCPRCQMLRVVEACATLPCKNPREWISNTEFEHCVEHLTTDEKETLEELISMYQEQAAEIAFGC